MTYNKLIQRVLDNPDPEPITLKELKNPPLINIVIPAWKEGIDFKLCLQSIEQLTYPNLHIIINAGGSETTEIIANRFQFHNRTRTTLLRQVGGSDNAAHGKIKALNECLSYIKKGVVWFIDADCYLTNELLYRMITPIIKLKEDVVTGAGLNPLPRQKGSFIAYMNFSRWGFHKYPFCRYYTNYISGANTMITYKAMKEIGRFTENRGYAEDTSRGMDISEKGFKIYALNNPESKIMTRYPGTIKEHFKQRHIYTKNAFSYLYKNKNYKQIIKMIVLSFISLFSIFTPIYLFIDLRLFLLGSLFLLFFYIKRIRLLRNYNRINSEKIKMNYGLLFIYTYIDLISNILW